MLFEVLHKNIVSVLFSNDISACYGIYISEYKKIKFRQDNITDMRNNVGIRSRPVTDAGDAEWLKILRPHPRMGSRIKTAPRNGWKKLTTLISIPNFHCNLLNVYFQLF